MSVQALKCTLVLVLVALVTAVTISIVGYAVKRYCCLKTRLQPRCSEST